VSAAKLKKQILVHLDGNPMSLSEVAEVMELKEKRTFKLLRSLFNKDQIRMIRGEDGARKYAKYDEA
jgi:DNA-binding IscR family transcriptional regulator